MFSKTSHVYKVRRSIVPSCCIAKSKKRGKLLECCMYTSYWYVRPYVLMNQLREMYLRKFYVHLHLNLCLSVCLSVCECTESTYQLVRSPYLYAVYVNWVLRSYEGKIATVFCTICTYHMKIIDAPLYFNSTWFLLNYIPTLNYY